MPKRTTEKSPRKARVIAVKSTTGSLPANSARETLLAAADALFRDLGFEATSTRDIIRASGLSLGTFYNYFKDKEELFEILLQERSGPAIAAQRAFRREATNFPDFVSRHFEYFFSIMLVDRKRFELFHRNLSAIRAVMSGPNEVQGLTMLEQDIQELIDAGTIAPIDPQFVAATIQAVTVELGSIVAKRKVPDAHAAAQFATQLLIGGLSWHIDSSPATERRPPANAEKGRGRNSIRRGRPK